MVSCFFSVAAAHRLRTIINYDKVIVMSAGRLVEEGSPVHLMRNPRSHFYALSKAVSGTEECADRGLFTEARSLTFRLVSRSLTPCGHYVQKVRIWHCRTLNSWRVLLFLEGLAVLAERICPVWPGNLALATAK